MTSVFAVFGLDGTSANPKPARPSVVSKFEYVWLPLFVVTVSGTVAERESTSYASMSLKEMPVVYVVVHAEEAITVMP